MLCNVYFTYGRLHGEKKSFGRITNKELCRKVLHNLRRSSLIKAICYHNTKITLPNLVPNSRLNEECPLGFAYEDGDFYVHMYGRGEGLYTIFPGLTVMEGKKMELH